MVEAENIDYVTEVTGDILVSAFPEQLDCSLSSRALWGYCLRIENNSNKRIRLIRKNFCFTNESGKCCYDLSQGFNGEMPDVEPGEFFEYEDTAIIEGNVAVLYGSCFAVDENGCEIEIKIPLLQLNAPNPDMLTIRFCAN